MKVIESKKNSQARLVPLGRPDKHGLAILIHSAAFCTYSVIHVGIKALNWAIHWLKVTVSPPFICFSLPIQTESSLGEETVVIALR